MEFVDPLRQNAYQYFLNQLMHIAHSDVITPDSSNHEFGLLLFATFLRFLPDFISDVGMDHIVIDRVIKIAAEHKIDFTELESLSNAVRADYNARNLVSCVDQSEPMYGIINSMHGEMLKMKAAMDHQARESKLLMEQLLSSMRQLQATMISSSPACFVSPVSSSTRSSPNHQVATASIPLLHAAPEASEMTQLPQPNLYTVLKKYNPFKISDSTMDLTNVIKGLLEHECKYSSECKDRKRKSDINQAVQYILTHFSPQDTDFAAALKPSPATESQQYLTWVQELNERTLRIATTIIDELLLNRDVPKLSSVVTMIQHPERVAKNRIKLGEVSVMKKTKLIM